jgi:hypothetical protein
VPPLGGTPGESRKPDSIRGSRQTVSVWCSSAGAGKSGPSGPTDRRHGA